MDFKKTFVRVMAFLVVVFVAGVGYLYTLVKEAGDRWPLYDADGSLTNAINGLEREIQTLRSQNAKIDEVKEKLELLRVEYDLAARVLPRENSPAQLIEAIRTKAQQTGVVPSRLVPQVGGRRGSSSFEEWRFNLAISGTYDQIATFINKMEEFESGDPQGVGAERRFFQVLEMNITAAGNGLATLTGSSPSGANASSGHACDLVMQTYRYSGDE